jgi:protein-S-isoprenylcysteine O-methyltransferase Ste14
VTALDFLARWRVRLGYVITVIMLVLARPTPRSIIAGAALGIIGLCIRAHAAGYLHKQEVLTRTGPYSHTRNPLYFGSSFLALGAAVATDSVWAAALQLVYFAVVYWFVMRREELELQQKHGNAFVDYAAAVPLFFPKLLAVQNAGVTSAGFSWAQYRKNHEYQAAFGYAALLLVFVLIWRLRLH